MTRTSSRTCDESDGVGTARANPEHRESLEKEEKEKKTPGAELLASMDQSKKYLTVALESVKGLEGLYYCTVLLNRTK